MPAVSKSQRRLMGACEYGADYASCPKGMTKSQMHDFATTKEKGLPARVKPKKARHKALRNMVPTSFK